MQWIKGTVNEHFFSSREARLEGNGIGDKMMDSS